MFVFVLLSKTFYFNIILRLLQKKKDFLKSLAKIFLVLDFSWRRVRKRRRKSSFCEALYARGREKQEGGGEGGMEGENLDQQ